MSASKYLGLAVGVIVYIFALALLAQVAPNAPTAAQLIVPGFVLFMMLGAISGDLLDMKSKNRELEEAIYRYKKFPQCFNLQDAVDARLTEVATYWHQYSQKFAKKGTEVAINQELDTFNKLYSLVEATYGNDVKLRDKDIRNYLPEEFKQAS